MRRKNFLEQLGLITIAAVTLSPRQLFAENKWKEENSEKAKEIEATHSVAIKSEPLDEKILRKYLTAEAQQVVFTPCFNTVVEQYEKNEDENLKHIEDMDGYIRKAYLCQFINFRCKGDLHELQYMRLCDIINKLVESGDIFYGSLCPPSRFRLVDTEFTQNEWVVFFYPVARTNYYELRKKYNFFTKEGELPEQYL